LRKCRLALLFGETRIMGDWLTKLKALFKPAADAGLRIRQSGPTAAWQLPIFTAAMAAMSKSLRWRTWHVVAHIKRKQEG
jgi:hypothetical protein